MWSKGHGPVRLARLIQRIWQEYATIMVLSWWVSYRKWDLAQGWVNHYPEIHARRDTSEDLLWPSSNWVSDVVFAKNTKKIQSAETLIPLEIPVKPNSGHWPLCGG